MTRVVLVNCHFFDPGAELHALDHVERGGFVLDYQSFRPEQVAIERGQANHVSIWLRGSTPEEFGENVLKEALATFGFTGKHERLAWPYPPLVEGFESDLQPAVNVRPLIDVPACEKVCE